MHVTKEQIGQAMLDLEKHENELGWDRPANLYFLRETEDAEVELIEMGIPPMIALAMDVMGPGIVFDTISRHVEDMSMANMPVPQDWIGVLFLAEAWMVTAEGPEEYEKLRPQAEARNLHVHPDKVEIRGLNALDAKGRTYTVVRKRDGEVELKYDEDKSHPDSGAIPEGLRRVVDAMLRTRITVQN